MKFLQAHKVLKEFSSDKKYRLKLVMSGQPENLTLFIRAEFALRNIACDVETIPFNTLYQYLLSPTDAGNTECFLLFPWDFLAVLDWRSGISTETSNTSLEQQLKKITGLFQQRNALFFYINAPVLSLYPSLAENQRLDKILLASALTLNAQLISPEHFSLSAYLNFGVPFAGNHCGDVAEQLAAALLPLVSIPKKLLVTDLDGVMWSGVIGEEGIEGIKCAPEGAGYPHFIYQTYLRKLNSEGVLLAAVSKNDPDIARLPFQNSQSILKEKNFVAIIASYEEKYGQIEALVAQLNLGFDACVFVDDNPIEIAKVAQQLPGVNCVAFPARADDLPEFLSRLDHFFSNNNITDEDKNRTSLYRTRLAGIAPVGSNKVDLESFLYELEMELHIYDRTHNQRERAIQLINKTNQFNLNGIRYTGTQVYELLADGGRLMSARLCDRHGDHGEVIACLLNSDEGIVSLVMSCRVLERKVEHAFLGWLATHILRKPNIQLQFQVTERNTPAQQFIANEGFAALAQSPLCYQQSRLEFITRQQSVAKLFQIFMHDDGSDQ